MRGGRPGGARGQPTASRAACGRQGGRPRHAEVLSALIRNTEHLSQVEAVYTTAVDSMAENGRGYVQVVTEYADDDSFNLRPRLKRVLNPFRVRVDPSQQRSPISVTPSTPSSRPTTTQTRGRRSSADPTRNSPAKDGTDWTGTENMYRANWFPSDNRRSASWTGTARSTRRRRSTNSTTARPRPGSRSWTTLAHAEPSTRALASEVEGMNDKDHTEWMQALRKQQTFRTRPVPHRVITVRRIDAKYIHETTIWPTPWQPFVPWVHEETDYMGERDMRGTVRDAKDAQRVYNVNVSSLSEAVNDAPKNRVVGYKGQFGKPDSLTRRRLGDGPEQAVRVPRGRAHHHRRQAGAVPAAVQRRTGHHGPRARHQPGGQRPEGDGPVSRCEPGRVQAQSSRARPSSPASVRTS